MPPGQVKRLRRGREGLAHSAPRTATGSTSVALLAGRYAARAAAMASRKEMPSSVAGSVGDPWKDRQTLVELVEEGDAAGDRIIVR